ncbi:MAG: hypothetical protein M3410_02470 [Acidobacteriota bacterium]|nr:hypothetical protein [Acidobacteriota bacterium]
MRSQPIPSVMMIVVIASLCFSVGEGLRLTPFPLSSLSQVESTNVLFDAKTSHETSAYKYGPLDVPTQIQKRSKRQAVDFACPPSRGVHKLLSYLYPLSDGGPVHIVSVLFVLRPAGRAPPFVS